MPDVSLTDFVDFVGKSGNPKLTLVRQIKDRGEYSPAEDFWRRLRNGIVEFHEKGHADKKRLDRLATGLRDKKKASNYPILVKQYKSFLGRKTIAWFKPSFAHWMSGGLDIRVNPELGLKINGDRHHLKLYFKGTPLTKAKADMVLLLMQQGLPGTQAGDSYSILDIRKKNLITTDAPNTDLLPLLHGEAAAYAAMWANL